MTYLSDVLPRPSRAARILGSDTAIPESTISVPPGSTRTAMLPPEPIRTETLSRRRRTLMFAFAASRLIASTGPADAGRAANAKTLVRQWRVVFLFMVFLFFWSSRDLQQQRRACPPDFQLAIGAPPMLLERSAIGPGMVVVHVRRGGASDGGGEADCSRRYRDRGTARPVAPGSPPSRPSPPPRHAP